MNDTILHLLSGIGALVVAAAFLWLIATVLDWIQYFAIGWRQAKSNAPAVRAWEQVDKLRAELAAADSDRDALLQALERNATLANAIRKAHEYATGEVDPSAAEDLARHLGEVARDWTGRGMAAEAKLAEARRIPSIEGVQRRQIDSLQAEMDTIECVAKGGPMGEGEQRSLVLAVAKLAKAGGA